MCCRAIRKANELDNKADEKKRKQTKDTAGAAAGSNSSGDASSLAFDMLAIHLRDAIGSLAACAELPSIHDVTVIQQADTNNGAAAASSFSGSGDRETRRSMLTVIISCMTTIVKSLPKSCEWILATLDPLPDYPQFMGKSHKVNLIFPRCVLMLSFCFLLHYRVAKSCGSICR
jgi:hypothetical protein